MGLRTALDGGLPVDGKQFAEAVILVTASGLVPGGEYDFKHPFGSDEVTAAFTDRVPEALGGGTSSR